MFAVGIGATSAVFSIVNAFLLKPLPFLQPDRLVAIPQIDLRDGTRMGMSLPDFVTYESEVAGFQSLAAYGKSTFSLRAGGLPEQVVGNFVTEQFFSVLGVVPYRGRTFSADDSDGTVVLSYRTWERSFQSNQSIIGKSIILDGHSTNIIGVMPEKFCFPDRKTQLWRLLRSDSYVLRGDEDLHFLYAFGRLRTEATSQQVQSQLLVVNRRLAASHPDMNINFGVSVVPLEQDVIRNFRVTLHALMLSAGFILLIACGNAVNLQLGRTVRRTKEFAIRVAHGAGKNQILGLLLKESLLLSVGGGIIGSVIAVLAVYFVFRIQPSAVPQSNELVLDLTVCAFTLSISIFAGLLCVLVSFVSLSDYHLLNSLNFHDERVTTAKRTLFFQRILIIAEVASTLVLLIGVGLMMKSLMRLSSERVGFSTDRLLTMSLRLQKSAYPSLEDLESFRRKTYISISQIPWVEAVANSSDVPLSGLFENFFSIRGRNVSASDQEMVGQASVSSGYFAMMGISLTAGREFAETDSPDTERVAVINESMSRRFWPGKSPLGSRIRHGLPDEHTKWYTIVGVVRDTVPVAGYPSVPTMFTSYSQIPEGYDDFLSRPVAILIRNKMGAPPSLTNDIRMAVSRVDPDISGDIRSVNQIMSNSLAEPSVRTIIFGSFGSIALCLSAVGIYGLVVTSIVSQTRPIGIRIALGASPGSVLRRIVAQSMMTTGIGVVFGFGLSLVLTRFLRSFLFEVSPTDARSMIGASAVLVSASLLATYIPARRAAKVDPAVVLREQ